MSFQTTKRELGEIYAFFRLLADGQVALGTAEAAPDGQQVWPVALVQREEHDGTRRYRVEADSVRIVSGCIDRSGAFRPDDEPEAVFPRQDFADAAECVLSLLRSVPGGEELEVPEALEGFLNATRIYDLEAKTDDRTDLHVAFWHAGAPLAGFSVRCRLAPMAPLLDGGRTANLKLEQTGVKFAAPMVNKVNALPGTVADRMRAIERLGGVLRYADVADRVFRCNLSMIDLHFPRLLAEMVRTMHLEDITRVADLTESMKTLNPLKIKDELIQKHGFYEYKVKQFLLALAQGMRPAKIFRGTASAVEGILLVDGEGRLLCYHRSQPDVFAEFLYRNTRFEKSAVEKDKYGYLERENGTYYFKLNAKIGLLKR